MSSNLISVKIPRAWGQGKGMLGALQDPVIFLAHNGAAYNPPAAAPRSYLVIPGGTITSERERLRADNNTASKHWTTAEHAKRIVVNIGANSLEPFVCAELDDPDEGLNNITVRDL